MPRNGAAPRATRPKPYTIVHTYNGADDARTGAASAPSAKAKPGRASVTAAPATVPAPTPPTVRPTLASRIARPLRTALFALALGGAAPTLGLSLYGAATGLPTTADLQTFLRQPTLHVTVADGRASVTACVCFLPVAAEDIPPHLRAALVAAEDRRFDSHRGIDLIGVARAAIANLAHRRAVEGGSTITQQLAKSLIGPRRTLDRKLRELVLARRIEAEFSKHDILRHYLDRAYFGRGATGIEAAARTFFGKAARDLTLFEAAALVGRLPAPSRAGAPHTTARPVLQAMVQAGALTQAQADAALTAGPRPGRLAPLAVDIRHYSSWVGRTMAAEGLEGRFRVAIGVDLRHQMAAHAAVAAATDSGALTPVQEVALVAIAPDGRVSALVGGRRYGRSQFDRATLAERQPGSTVKPFTFLAALEAGWRPEAIIDDAPVSLGSWQPRNHDRRHLGPIPLTDALRRSRNAATVRLAAEVGVETVAALFRRFGLQAEPGRPAFLLGAEGTRLIDLAAAYATLAAQGRPVAAAGALVALRDGGAVAYRAPSPQAAPAAGAEAVAALNAMLRLDGASGLHGKSGTSQASRDALFAGFSAQATAAVWVGRDDAAPMPGVVGGGVSAGIWRGFLTALPEAR